MRPTENSHEKNNQSIHVHMQSRATEIINCPFLKQDFLDKFSEQSKKDKESTL